MYAETIDAFIKTAERKIAAMRESPLGFFVASMLAGAYVGIGIILIFSIGNQTPPQFQKLVWARPSASRSRWWSSPAPSSSPAIPCSGHCAAIAHRNAGRTWARAGHDLDGKPCRLARPGGAFALGGAALLSAPDTLVMKVAAVKMNASGSALFARAILCNWLVCLAIWMAARVNSDSAKCIVIFWCLLAFIASGFEHSVANMTLLGLALAGNHP
jgi:nitrite transporter NirC